jgi:hypothetical protein
MPRSVIGEGLPEICATHASYGEKIQVLKLVVDSSSTVIFL